MVAAIVGILVAIAAGQSVDEVPPAQVPGDPADAVITGASVIGPTQEGRELIGKAAPALNGVRWLDGQAHPLSEDRGKVVLIRWWTDSCKYCVNTAPALRALQKKFGADLVVRAIYHEKPAARMVTSGQIARALDELGLPFLVGHDREWPALRSWWLADGPRQYTSVSFLIDPEGKIALIHTGTEYHTRKQVPDSQSAVGPAQAEQDYRRIEATIATLLAARAAAEGAAGE